MEGVHVLDVVLNKLMSSKEGIELMKELLKNANYEITLRKEGGRLTITAKIDMPAIGEKMMYLLG